MTNGQSNGTETESVASDASLAFVALGSNLGDSKAIIGDAIGRLKQLSTVPSLCSSRWRSTPVDCPPGSPDFVNAVVGLVLQAGETPESLLTNLQKIEGEFGRNRGEVRNAPRSLDLDLIAFGAEVRGTSTLTLPHPYAHQRRFVLQPLSEIAPALILPGQTQTVEELLGALDSDERLVRLRD